MIVVFTLSLMFLQFLDVRELYVFLQCVSVSLSSYPSLLFSSFSLLMLSILMPLPVAAVELNTHSDCRYHESFTAIFSTKLQLHLQIVPKATRDIKII